MRSPSVGTLHRKVVLSFEMRVVGGEDVLCEVLVEGLTSEMYEGRLIKKLAGQAVECG